MANITNAEAVSFCNEKARTLANLIEKMDRTLDAFALDVVQMFESNTGGNGDNDPIIDYSGVPDARHRVTKIDVPKLKYVCEQLKACMNTDDRRAVVHNWATDGTPIY